ncbi:MAG: metallophosphoesterase [Tannerellaceae bacterium]|nr:metallophosphoesterase [Tannerellaceae bacterium]
MPIFIILFFCIYSGGNLYIFLKAWHAMSGLPVSLKILIGIVYWGCALSFFAMFKLRNATLPDSFFQFLHEVGTSWFVFTLYMVLLLLVVDILKLFHIQFVYSFQLVLGIVICLLLYGYNHYRHPKTEVINIVINKRPENQDNLKIVAISDIHLGYGTTKSMLKQYVEKINEQQPDLILIGGDLIDNSVRPLRHAKMEEELRQLKAPLGIYMVPGNHEYISGIQPSIDFIQQTPIQLLIDSVITLPNQIQIVGRDDRANPSRASLDLLMKQVDPELPVILLDHQPYHLQEAVQAGIDLQFSGHTHRGQIWPVSLLTDKIFELSHGYLRKENSHLYVSSGLSLWGPPFRIGTQSELVVFNISFQ